MAIFPTYYQTELAYLRELLREYARSYPEVAHMVGERGSDRSVERLVQGAALLTARLRFRVDDDFPEVVHTLFDRMWGQYLRPLPAATLLQFSPRENALRQSQAIAARTPLRSQPFEAPGAGSLSCCFTTSSTLLLHPLELVEADINRAHPADLQLRLRLRLTGGATFRNTDISALRIHLLGEPTTRYALYYWLAHCTRGLSVRDAAGRTVRRLGARAVQPGGFGEQDALTPFQAPPLTGLRLLQEYFAFPDKFLAIDIRGLGRLAAEGQREVDLVFHLGQPPDDRMTIDASNFALGCTPAINVSEAEQLTIAVLGGATELALRLPRDAPVFDVERVGAYHRETSEWIEYEPFLAPGVVRTEDGAPCFQVHRRADGVEGVQTYLAITDTQGRPQEPETEMLYVWLTRTDGELAARVGQGRVDVPTAASPEYVTFTNITPVMPPVPTRIGRDRHWQLLAFFAIHPDDLASVNGLEQLVGEARGGRSGGGERPEILNVSSSISGRVHRRTVVPVRQVIIDLADESFLCPGQQLLFGHVLRHLFARPFDSHVFNQIIVRGRPSGATYTFDPH